MMVSEELTFLILPTVLMFLRFQELAQRKKFLLDTFTGNNWMWHGNGSAVGEWNKEWQQLLRLAAIQLTLSLESSSLYQTYWSWSIIALNTLIVMVTMVELQPLLEQQCTMSDIIWVKIVKENTIKKLVIAQVSVSIGSRISLVTI